VTAATNLSTLQLQLRHDCNILILTKKRKPFSIQRSAILESAELFERFPGFAPLSLWQQYVDQLEYGALAVPWLRQFAACPSGNNMSIN
jgi:hypothetical protein